MVDLRRGLPRRPIFYTEDQVAAMLSLPLEKLQGSYLWRVGRDSGVYRNSYLRAVKIPKPDRSIPEFRVAEGELIRWLRFHDLWIYDPAAETYDLPPLPGSGDRSRVEPEIDIRRTEPVHPNDESPDPELLDL